MEWILREMKQAARRARREPAFSAVIVLTLGLAMGSSAAILGVVNATFFSALPIPESGRVLRIYASYRKADGSISQVTVRGREFNTLEQVTTGANGPFAAVVGLEDVQVTLTGIEKPQRVTLILCTAGWLPTLGTQPQAGRWPNSQEARRGSESGVAVIAHELAGRRFGGGAQALGQTMTLDGRIYSIIGVMPPGFRFPYDAEVWTPVTTPWDLTRDYAVFARLKPGITRESTHAALDGAAKSVRAQFPDTAAGLGFSDATLMENLLENREGAALALAGVAAFFLLLASANVANLLLARSVTRQREQAIRTALGASRWELSRSTLVEAVLLATTATCAGLLLASWLGGWLDLLVPSNFTRQFGILPNTANVRVVVATAATGLFAGLLSGLLPALGRGRASLDGLMHASLRTGRSKRETWLMDGFVAAQFTLALALLAGAGFMMRNFQRLAHRDLGIDASRLVSFQVSVTAPRYQEAAARRALVRDILREVQATSGVVTAGVTTLNPLGQASWLAPVVAEGQEEVSEASTALVNHRLITPELCSAMGIPLLRGRFFNEQDNENAPPVVLVSRLMASKFFGGADPIGKRVRVNRAGQPWLTVVGLVGDVLDAREPGAPKETWYLPYPQFAASLAASTIIVMVRAAADPRGVQGAVEQAVARVDRNLAVFNQSTMDGVYRKSLEQDRLSMILIVALATFGLLLGALGIYGTLSLTVGERVREIGIRMALGATPSRVLRTLLGHGLRISLSAAVLGLGAAWLMGRVLSRQLSQVSPADPLVMSGAAGVLLTVALLAVYIPARRAAAVDPIVALKQE